MQCFGCLNKTDIRAHQWDDDCRFFFYSSIARALVSRRIDPKSERMKSSDCRLPELHVMNNDSWSHSRSSLGMLYSITTLLFVVSKLVIFLTVATCSVCARFRGRSCQHGARGECHGRSWRRRSNEEVFAPRPAQQFSGAPVFLPFCLLTLRAIASWVTCLLTSGTSKPFEDVDSMVSDVDTVRSVSGCQSPPSHTLCLSVYDAQQA